MNTRTLPILGVLVLLFVNTLPARSQGTCESGSAGAFFTFLVGGTDHCNLPFLPGVVTVQVVAYSVPIQRVRLTLPDPPKGTVIGQSWGVSYTGDRATGLEIDLGSCLPAGLVVIGEMQIQVEPGESVPCQNWWIGASEVQDCAGMWRPGGQPVNQIVGDTGDNCYLCCWQCCASGLPPYDLYPPDGKTNVRLNTTLYWTSQGDYDDPFRAGCWIEIGTQPGCVGAQRFQVSCDQDRFYIQDFLQPATTYYWRAGWYVPAEGCYGAPGGISPIHSFRTEDPLAATTTTWGRVKAMYHD